MHRWPRDHAGGIAMPSRTGARGCPGHRRRQPCVLDGRRRVPTSRSTSSIHTPCGLMFGPRDPYVDAAALRLVRVLAGACAYLFVVGDDDRRSTRGGSPRSRAQFRADRGHLAPTGGPPPAGLLGGDLGHVATLACGADRISRLVADVGFVDPSRCHLHAMPIGHPRPTRPSRTPIGH